MPVELIIEEEEVPPTVVEYAFQSDFNTVSGEYDTEKYFRAADEIIHYIAHSKIKFWTDCDGDLYLNLANSKSVEHFINELETGMEANKVPRFISEYQPLPLLAIKNIIKDTPHHMEKRIARYTADYKQLLEMSKATKEKSVDCLRNNWTVIKQYLSTYLADNKAERAKLRLKQSQAKYYQKKKAELGIVAKPTLTAEEKAEKYKEQLQKANKKYYEKKRAELIEVGVMKPKQTDEEKRIARQEANKRYYASKNPQQPNATKDV